MKEWHVPPQLDLSSIEDDTPFLIVSSHDDANVLAEHGFPALGLPGSTDPVTPEDIVHLGDLLPCTKGKVYIYLSPDVYPKKNLLDLRDQLAVHLHQVLGISVHLLASHIQNPAKLVTQSMLSLQQYLTRHHAIDDHLVYILKMNKDFMRIQNKPMTLRVADGVSLNKPAFRLICNSMLPPYLFRPGLVAMNWWSSPWTRQLRTTIFDHKQPPGLIETPEGFLYNRWVPYEIPPEPIQEENIQPFMALFNSVFHSCEESIKEFFLDLMAYKIQNFDCRIPYAFMMLGLQGTGKSLLGNALLEAFCPYSMSWTGTSLCISPKSLNHNLFIYCDDAAQGIFGKSITTTRRVLTEPLLSSSRRPLINRSLWLFSSNSARVGNTVKDERRFVTIRSELPLSRDIFDNFSAWKQAGYAKYLTKFFFERDLSNFVLPMLPPLTAEMAFTQAHAMDLLSSFAHQVKNSMENPLTGWIKDLVAVMRLDLCSPSLKRRNTAKQVLLNLTTIRVRPFLTVRELEIVLRNYLLSQYKRRWGEISIGEIVHSLRMKGIRTLINPNSIHGFEWNGSVSQYIILHDKAIKDSTMSQETFESYMQASPVAFTESEIQDIINSVNSV